ncbi:hypothetical protein M0R72_01350 [Candidatus Pacearchaeota archaeon]|jgi:hypothetical protein|nr:hypothetical protein [Candidatus Pacearchaeota archaeon]
MNPDTNQLEALREVFENKSVADQLREQLIGIFDGDFQSALIRPDGSKVPKHWAIFQVGELVVLKDYTFKIAYMNDGTIILEPVGPIEVGKSFAEELLNNKK